MLTATVLMPAQLRGYSIPLIDLSAGTSRPVLVVDREPGRYSWASGHRESPAKGDWVAWVGRNEDVVQGKEGQRLLLSGPGKAPGRDSCHNDLRPIDNRRGKRAVPDDRV